VWRGKNICLNSKKTIDLGGRCGLSDEAKRSGGRLFGTQPMTTRKQLSLEEVVGQIGRMTQHLLEGGAEPSQVAFALTSVAADMGLQLTGDPLKVLPVLLNAISGRISDRLQKREAKTLLDATAELPANGTTIH
jgi:hypothetical protein